MSIRYLIVGWEAQARDWVLHHVSAAYPYAELRTMTIAEFEKQRASINRRNTDVIVLCAAFGAQPDERKSEGITALKKVAQQPAFPAIVVVADGGSEFTAVRALRLGALDYLPRRYLTGERLLETLEKTIRYVQERPRRPDEPARAPSRSAATSQQPQVAVPEPVSIVTTAAPAEAPELLGEQTPSFEESAQPVETPNTPDAHASLPLPSPMPSESQQLETAASEPVMTALEANVVVAAPAPTAANETLGPMATAQLLEAGAANSQPELAAVEPDSLAPAPAQPAAIAPATADPVESIPAPTRTEASGIAEAAPLIDMAEVFADPSPSNVQPAVQPPKARPVPISKTTRNKRPDPWPEVPGYTILQRIAESDHAFVLLARQGKRRESIALKISKIARGTATGARGVASASLEREFETLSTLSHRSVVAIYDFGTVNSFDYLAMEYFPCGDLRRRLQNPLTEVEIIDYTRQVARALEFVHRVGLVHGDLKPQNVMLRADNSIALIDFGLVSDPKREATKEQTGLVCGSPYYMSPEQTHSQRLDGRSDLYSLGVMLYEMLTGKRPFVAKTIPEIIDMHRNAVAAPLPAEFARFQPVIERLLAKEPEARFADASQLLQALDSFGGARAPTAAAPA